MAPPTNLKDVPPEIAAAYKEARARGVPAGWTCTIDKRNRRKWTAPNNGRSCDSIPKAIAISVDMGLLPANTIVPSGRKKKKRGAMAGAASKRPRKRSKSSDEKIDDAAAAESLLSMVSSKPSEKKEEEEKEEDVDDQMEEDESSDSDDGGPPPVPMNPETTLNVNTPTGNITRKEATLPTTVHWDPTSPDGRKIGWKVKIETGTGGTELWMDGRVIRYDPHTHKHKIQPDDGNKRPFWIWLRNEQFNLQLATRLVWAHVKGYAWWPALVMESNSEESKTKEGYVLLEFFGTGEISCLRDNPESVRPFDPDMLDPIVSKHKKKRNQKAFQLACEEFSKIQKTRNEAALYYAKAAFEMSCYYAPKNTNGTTITASTHQNALIGRKVQIFRSDVNYPYGDTVVGRVRQYSSFQKKWLISFEISEQQSTKAKYAPAWINLYGKEHALKIIEKRTGDDIDNEDLLPFLFGYKEYNTAEKDKILDGNYKEIMELMKTRCRGCVEYLKVGGRGGPIQLNQGKDDLTVTCEVCEGIYHLGCVDPPMTLEMWQRMMKDGSNFVCSRCTPCRGCYQKDVAFGCHTHPSPPPTLSLPEPTLSTGGKVTLDLCSMCKVHYDAERFCPNCAHSWDDKKYDMVRRQIEYGGSAARSRKRKGAAVLEDSAAHLYFGTFEGDDDMPIDFKVDPTLFYPETSEWGYSEDEMLVCDNCNIWVHAGCAGVDEDDYDDISSGKHPIYSKEFLCRMCCRRRCKVLIEALQAEDKTGLFAAPVSEKIVPNYRDIIKEPMDLQTMLRKVETDEYLNYAWVREAFELMVFNALTFNRYYTDVWREAQRFYHDALENVFSKLGKGAPPGKYEKGITKCFDKAEKERINEIERVQVDESVEKKDLVAGSLNQLKIVIPKLRDAPPDQPSCIPCKEVKMRKLDAYYSSWMDCCFTCGTSGAADTFLFCVDCGEAFHSFCVNAPVHSMRLSSVAGWRCPNCKICEISGEVPADEARMLYCEMCDRAFIVDLLDPPLEHAPTGLWICGQCVDCKTCGNTRDRQHNGQGNADPALATDKRYWSQDPEKCYRCGGCNDVFDDNSAPPLQCQVCSGLLREGDTDIIDCSKCQSKVHFSCDERAAKYGTTNDSLNDEKSTNQYSCPRCYKPSANAIDNKEKQEERKQMSTKVWELIYESKLGPHQNYSDAELHSKLLDQIDFAVRDQWRDEYLSIICDAIRIYCMAKSLGDPRFVIQQVLQRMSHLPPWIGHRALRFAVLAKQKQWDVKGFASERPVVIVITAKLAASFIDIVSRTLGISKEKDVSFHDRLERLVVPPANDGIFTCPFDSIKKSSDSITLDESGNVVAVERKQQTLDEGKTTVAEPQRIESNQCDESPKIYKVASPMCGWNDEVSSPTGLAKWKDTRECCLCHLCGDDDAGLPELNPDAPDRAMSALGRLLPMADGYWVHTSCALWSSEVWEAQDDGLVHAVEKARGRGAQLKCFGCGFHGATVGCCKTNCPFNYHFPCAKACGAVFSTNQQVFCANHKSSAISTLQKESIELMKSVMVAPEKKAMSDKEASESAEAELCSRVGTLVIHSLGKVESQVDGFHSDNYIMPPGYVSSRIYWSARRPKVRTTYLLSVNKTSDGTPEFSIIPGDDPTAKITGTSVSQVYSILMDRVRKVNQRHFSQGNMFSKLPVVRRTRRRTHGLNGPQFFGFGLDHVRRLLESSPGVEAVAAPLSSSSPQYRFCFAYGPDASDPSALLDLIRDLQRKRAAAKAEQALTNSSGCARTEGIKAVHKSGGSGRITRALVRSAEDDVVDAGSASAAGKNRSEEKAKADRNIVQVKYRQMKAIPIEQRLVARRSHIHGWGLFTKIDIPKYNPVVEYMGEVIRQPVADKREKAYELSGEGSCYMFRLDLQRIVDATKIGSMARFMNHSCQPNAYAKILSVDTDLGQERKIVVFALRDIAAGEEITYDYKFPVEDGSIRCTCGAPNCIGRLN